MSRHSMSCHVMSCHVMARHGICVLGLLISPAVSGVNITNVDTHKDAMVDTGFKLPALSMPLSLSVPAAIADAALCRFLVTRAWLNSRAEWAREAEAVVILDRTEEVRPFPVSKGEGGWALTQGAIT